MKTSPIIEEHGYSGEKNKETVVLIIMSTDASQSTRLQELQYIHDPIVIVGFGQLLGIDATQYYFSKNYPPSRATTGLAHDE